MSITTSDAADVHLDAVFGALSNTTRRRLLHRLGSADATISELAAPFDMTLPAVSKHLRVLEEAGLVTRTRDGKAHRCTLVPDPLADAEAWLVQRRNHWSESLDALATYLQDEDEASQHDDRAQ